MFVQDFVRIEQPLATSVEVFEREIMPRLAELVRQAWDLPDLPDGPGTSDRGESEVRVTVTPRRARSDSVVYTITWPAASHPWFPEFDADLELAMHSPTETHMQLSGQSRFPRLERWSSEDLRASRNTMAAVDRLLSAMADAIASHASSPNAEAQPT